MGNGFIHVKNRIVSGERPLVVAGTLDIGRWTLV